MSESHINDLFIERVIAAPAHKIYSAWTNPELLKQWFCPKPWAVSSAYLEPVVGGAKEITMKGPEGEVVENNGIYLELVPNRLIVVTDAYTKGWVPAEKPFMTGIVELQEMDAEQTHYKAIARHWCTQDKETHEAMGFYDGWGAATDQLEELLTRL